MHAPPKLKLLAQLLLLLLNLDFLFVIEIDGAIERKKGEIKCQHRVDPRSGSTKVILARKSSFFLSVEKALWKQHESFEFAFL